MDLMKEEDGTKEFFQDLLKGGIVSIIGDKFKQKNGQIIKYEYFNEKPRKVSDDKDNKAEGLEQQREKDSNFN